MSALFANSSDSLPSVPSVLAHAIRPLPLLPLEIALAAFLQRVCRRNPRLFERLGSHQAKRFGIKPTDLPFAFVIQAAAPRPQLAVVREFPADLDAHISSSLANLLALVEGRLDGDALMFSRQLVIEGDVEAVLALRNAIDDARLDFVAEIGGLFGPLGEPVKRILGAAREAVLAPVPSNEETK
jgi:O2-independent ubiquinone biosynthesis accessory factor UbiT